MVKAAWILCLLPGAALACEGLSQVYGIPGECRMRVLAATLPDGVGRAEVGRAESGRGRGAPIPEPPIFEVGAAS